MAKRVIRKKVNVNDRVKQGITTVAVGAGVQVVDALVGENTAGDIVNYAELGIGIALPVIMPGTERIGDAVAAVAAYKVAKDMNLAGKIGLGSEPATTGLGDNAVIGNMFREKKNAEMSFTKKKDTKSDENPIG